MGNIQFGGPLGVFTEPQSNIRVSPRVMGAASVAFEPRDDFRNAARACLVKHTGEQIKVALTSGTAFLDIDQSPTFATSIAAAVSAELGVPIEVSMVKMGLSEEDSESLLKAVAAQAAANRARAAAAPAPAPAASTCSRCGAPGKGKFCASCGGPMSVAAAPAPAPAPPAAPVAPSNLSLPAGQWLSRGVPEAIAPGSHVTVPQGYAFVGFVSGALALNLPAGQHVISRACDKGAFIRLSGLPFSFATSVKDHGRMQFQGTWYVQDPAVSVAEQMHIDDNFGIFTIVIGRAADKVVATVNDERSMCLATANAVLQDSDHVKGTVIVLDMVRPVAQ